MCHQWFRVRGCPFDRDCWTTGVGPPAVPGRGGVLRARRLVGLQVARSTWTSSNAVDRSPDPRRIKRFAGSAVARSTGTFGRIVGVQVGTWGSSECQALGGFAGCSFDLGLIKRGGPFSGPTPDQASSGVRGCSLDRDFRLIVGVRGNIIYFGQGSAQGTHSRVCPGLAPASVAMPGAYRTRRVPP